MKKLLIIGCSGLFLMAANAQSGSLKDIWNKKKAADSANGKTISSIFFEPVKSSDSLSEPEIISGLKEALEKGVEKAGGALSATDGFFANAALKILMPAEAKEVEQKLRGIGLGRQVDQAILSMNRAAEDATKSAAPIFVTAIKKMTLANAVQILKGNDTAATAYLRANTVSQLTEAFRPTIETSLEKVNATKYWNVLMSTYNKISAQKINPDLAAYVTEKSLQGIFLQLGEEEKAIRKNPLARTTELLKKVFGSKT